MSALGRAARALLATLGMTVLVLSGMEGALRIVGWETPLSLRGDPYVNLLPFFRPARGAHGIPLMRHLNGPVEFLAHKPVNGFRVFVLGESSVAGVPYPPEYAFAAFLQRRLSAALPGFAVEVVNCGVSAGASWHLVRVAREVVNYAPDVVILYAGHNDYVVREPPPELAWLERAARLRLVQVGVRAGIALRRWRRGTFDPSEAGATYQPLLIRERASGNNRLTAQERARVLQRFAANVRAIIALTRSAGAIFVATTVAQNLHDWEPGASVHQPDLPEGAVARWDHWLAKGDVSAGTNDCRGALHFYDRAAAIDRRPARLHFARARCLERFGAWSAARQEYRRASDLDGVPMGAPTALNVLIRRLAQGKGVPLANVERALAARAPHHLPGNDRFVDYIHPNLQAHQEIAAILAETLRRHAIPLPMGRWVQRRDVDVEPSEILRMHPELARYERLIRIACLYSENRTAEAERERAALDLH